MTHRHVSVVIADDDATSRAFLESVIAGDADVEVVASCADASSALGAIRHHRPDVALLDQFMPGGDGLDIARTIHEEGITTAVALISAGLDGVAVPDVQRAGIAACLEKGTFSRRQLIDRVQALAEIARSPQAGAS
jgi:DNA-binding NarL/FixJ family response regulator